MFLLHKFLNFQYPPEAGAGAGTADKPAGGSPELTKGDIIDFLGEDDDDKEIIAPKDDKKDDKKDDDKKPEKKAKEDKTDEEDEDDENEDELDDDDELADLEEELEDPSADKLELTTPTSRREILKKYPKLFKDFPNLEKAYYREQQFTKLLPTIDDAKEAVDAKATLTDFENDLGKGDTETILKAVKQENPKAFDKLVDNYLDVLGKVDKEAFHHVIGNTLRSTIQAMVAEARTSQNEALEAAAVLLNQFAFGSSKFTPPSKLATEDKTDKVKEDTITERERAFTKQRLDSATGTLNTKVNRVFKTTIEANIDPKKSMPDYVRKSAARDALEQLESAIKRDTRFSTLVDKLWERALKEDFSDESINKIYGAWKSKAGTLINVVVKRARNEALRGINRKAKDDDDDSRPDSDESKNGKGSSRRNEPKSGAESHRRNDSDKNKVPDGMSSLDYLMSDD